MALYALDEEILIYAADAEERRVYRCSGCFKPVRVRKGLYRLPHFYHLSLSPSCRLYSKSQDHLVAQLALQKLLPQGEVTLEKSFLEILRVADVVWEPQKLIFEIQCSLLSEFEAKKRIEDYAKVGYQIVWLLDDRIFNRRVLRPAEKWLREGACYYAALRKQSFPIFYDQFEVLHEKKRVCKGKALMIGLSVPKQLSQISWEEKNFPRQVLQRVFSLNFYFHGDLVDKAVLSHAFMSLAMSMLNLRGLEELHLEKEKDQLGWFKAWMIKLILKPVEAAIFHLLELTENL